MHRNRLLLISMLLLTLGVIFFSFAVKKYQVLTSSKAAGENIIVTFAPGTTFGEINQSVGIIVGNISGEGTVADLQKYFKGKGMYLKLINPTAETINSQAFTTLQQDGFQWYLGFDTYEKMNAAAAAYYAKYQSEIVVELTSYEAFDVAKTQTLKTTYPKVQFHTSGFIFWPRDKVKDILTKAPPPLVDVISFQTRATEGGTLWQYLKLMYATFYDASMDVPGDSGISMNYPANTSLSLSRINILGSQVQNQIRRFSNVISAVVSSVSSQGTTGKAPIRFIIAGDYEQLNASDKTVLSTFASTLQLKPAVAWPEAIPSNGDPWNNTMPVAGFMSVKDNKWYGMLLNTDSTEKTIQLPNLDYTGYQTYSTIRGKTSILSTDKKIIIQPYEVIAFIPSTIIIPDGSNSPPPQSGILECDSGPDPYNSNKIVIKNGTSQTIDKIEVDLFHCTYIPGKLEQYRGSYRCEGGDQGCADGAASCFKGTWDQAFSQPKRNITLAPGQSMTFEYVQTPCKTAQMDVRTMNNGIAEIECHNVQSSNTVQPGEMWPGGYAFAISENSDGYNASTQSCPQITATPTQTPSPTLTHTPTHTHTPTPTASNTPSPTATPVPTNTPTPSPVVPTNTPVPPTITPTPTQTVIVVVNTPTPTPVTELVINNQAPGFNPWLALLIPFGLVILGLAL